MSRKLNLGRRSAFAGITLIAGASLALSALAQQAAPPAPGTQAINVRKAVFTLIGSGFKPVGEVLQGHAAYDADTVQKSAARVAFLAQYLNDVFPDNSSSGDTKARPEIWTNRADFDKRVKDFQDHTAALVQVAQSEKSANDTFKTAAAAVGQDCKGCHENYKVK